MLEWPFNFLMLFVNDNTLYAEKFPQQKGQFLESPISLWGLDKPFLKLWSLMW